MIDKQFHTFPAPAKLNLFLHIVGRLANGYHQLETVFQFLDHHDTIDIKITDTPNLTLLTPISGVNNEDNLIIKAASLLQKSTGVEKGAQIRINKVLPMGGGLGGGSSNAATILVALNHLWQTALSTEKLATLGLSLGADIPIFIHGFSAFAQGVGEKLTPANPKCYYYLVTKPNCSISTQKVFTAKDLKRDTARISYHDKDIENYGNDCQTWVINHYPEVAKLLAWLVEYAPSQITGTGACIFSRFNTPEQAKSVQAKLPQGIASFVAKGLNKSPLISAIENLTLRL